MRGHRGAQGDLQQHRAGQRVERHHRRSRWGCPAPPCTRRRSAARWRAGVTVRDGPQPGGEQRAAAAGERLEGDLQRPDVLAGELDRPPEVVRLRSGAPGRGATSGRGTRSGGHRVPDRLTTGPLSRRTFSRTRARDSTEDRRYRILLDHERREVNVHDLVRRRRASHLLQQLRLGLGPRPSAVESSLDRRVRCTASIARSSALLPSGLVRRRRRSPAAPSPA